MTMIRVDNLTPEALSEVLNMALKGATAESINRLLAVTTDATTLYAAFNDCLDEDNDPTLLRAAADIRASASAS